MRAIQITEFGGPEVMHEVDVAAPEPQPGEVLIEVTRAGVNFADTHSRTGSYVAQPELPLIPGMEVAGRRTDTGERVIALTGTGGYAQYATAPEHLTFPTPDDITDDDALAVLIQGLTAWHLYRTAARVTEGESVVVHSAAGGTGGMAVQLGRPMGARRIIATASSPERREHALALGADVAIDPDPQNLTERLIEANDGKPVDVVFEMYGGEVFEASYKALAHFGRIVVCGISTNEPNHPSTGSLLRHSRSVVGLYLMHTTEKPDLFAAALTDLLDRLGRKQLRAVVGSVYPLSEAARAHEDLRARRTSGKLLLDPSA